MTELPLMKFDEVDFTVVVEHVLKTLRTKERGEYAAIFRGRTVDGRKLRFKFNDYDLDKPQTMGRAPLVGEVWEISGTLERDPEHGEQVIVETARLTRPNGHLLIDVLLSFPS